MKHIVFILGSYSPNFSAVGNCARQIIQCLKDEYRITVLCIRSDLNSPRLERIDGVHIVRIDTPLRLKRLNLMFQQSSSKPFSHLRLNLHRISVAARKLLSIETVERDLISAYLHELEALDHKVDIIVPLVFPFESVLTALTYKNRHPGILVIPYIFDNFVESRSLHLLSLNRILKQHRHVKLERRMLDESDFIIAMHPLRHHFTQHFPFDSIQSIRFMEHPLLTQHNNITVQQRYLPIIITYTGTLIKNVHDTSYLLNMLQAMPIDDTVQIDFYVMGNDAHKVKSTVVNDRLLITNHGKVSKEHASAAIIQSNILLNLGEVRGKQVSSKVFEYMAAGKPIIHLAFVTDDVVTTILSKYPLSLCLVQKWPNLKENARLCADFIERHKYSQLDFSTVAALYPEAIPTTTADLMRKLFNRMDQ